MLGRWRERGRGCYLGLWSSIVCLDAETEGRSMTVVELHVGGRVAGALRAGVDCLCSCVRGGGCWSRCVRWSKWSICILFRCCTYLLVLVEDVERFYGAHCSCDGYLAKRLVCMRLMIPLFFIHEWSIREELEILSHAHWSNFNRH